MDPLDLDGRVFDLVSSTASEVDRDAPTRFQYSESDGVVWGAYSGDTVTTGRFVGARIGDRVEISFVHALTADGATVSGTSLTRVTSTPVGLRLVEEFEADGTSQTSICDEVRPAS